MFQCQKQPLNYYNPHLFAQDFNINHFVNLLNRTSDIQLRYI